MSIKKEKKIFDLERKTKILGKFLKMTKCVNCCPFYENKTKLKYSHPKYIIQNEIFSFSTINPLTDLEIWQDKENHIKYTQQPKKKAWFKMTVWQLT